MVSKQGNEANLPNNGHTTTPLKGIIMNTTSLLSVLGNASSNNASSYDALAKQITDAGLSVRMGKNTASATVLIVWQGGVKRGADVAHVRLAYTNLTNVSLICKALGTKRKTGDVLTKQSANSMQQAIELCKAFLNEYQPINVDYDIKAIKAQLGEKQTIDTLATRLANDTLPRPTVDQLINEANASDVENDVNELGNVEKPKRGGRGKKA